MVKAATPEKATEEMIEVTALKAFFIDYTPTELKKINDRLKEKGKHATGMTKRINPAKTEYENGEEKTIPAETALVTKSVAKKLQENGAAKINL